MALTRSINRPTKSASNPLLEAAGANTATWDHDKNYVDVHLIGGTYYAWYASIPDDTVGRYLCRVSSADGITWTKDNLGLVEYDGDTDNNIVLSSATLGVFNPAVHYDASRAAGWEYIFAVEKNTDDDGNEAVNLYRSGDGINLTFVKSLSAVMRREAKELVQMPSGKWMLFYSFFHTYDTRKIGVYQSVTDDLAGDWFDRGQVIDTDAETTQKYCIGIELVGDTLLATVPIYNSTTEQMIPALYTSHDGIHWTEADATWIPLGAVGEWDDEMNTGSKALIHVGNDWRLYYAGFATGHAGPLPFDSRIGLATIGYQRIGQVAGTGDLTTVALTPAAGEKLYINCDASGVGAKIEVEVIESGSPKAGYAWTDCDDVTADTYSAEVTWGGSSLPTGSEIQLKFYLTDATLYAYEVK